MTSRFPSKGMEPATRHTMAHSSHWHPKQGQGAHLLTHLQTPHPVKDAAAQAQRVMPSFLDTSKDDKDRQGVRPLGGGSQEGL